MESKYCAAQDVLHHLKVRMTAFEKTIASGRHVDVQQVTTDLVKVSISKGRIMMPQTVDRTTGQPERNDNNRRHDSNTILLSKPLACNNTRNLRHEPVNKEPGAGPASTRIVSPECHGKLKKQYRDIKKKQLDLSRLLNSMPSSIPNTTLS